MENVPLRIQRFAYDMIYYVLWMIEIVLFLRFLLKLLGANPANEFIAFLYSLAGVLMGPFLDIFGVSSVNNMVLEPSVLVAMVFYAIVAYVLVAFVRLLN